MAVRLLVILLFVVDIAPAQQRQLAVAFWNIENLFDTLDDPLTEDGEFTPAGRNAWTTQRYRTKLEHVSEIISGLVDRTGAPALVGLCEVENARVLADLVAMPSLAGARYKFLHRDSPDPRGIDVGLLYDSAVYVPDTTWWITLKLPGDKPTREVLVSSGVLAGEKIVILVNHWPSRRGGARASSIFRVTAAMMVKRVTDSLQAADSTRGLIAMGDFNDDPVDHSVQIMTDRRDTSGGKKPFVNPMQTFFRKGIGTLAWNDAWNLFDQVLYTEHFANSAGLRFQKAVVGNRQRLRAMDGRYRGYPFRTFSGGIYTGGYSDHFPVYIVLEKPDNVHK